MTNIWGVPAYLYSEKLYYINNFDFYEYFQRSSLAVSFFNWSQILSWIFPAFISIIFFGLLLALSVKFKKNTNMTQKLKRL